MWCSYYVLGRNTQVLYLQHTSAEYSTLFGTISTVARTRGGGARLLGERELPSRARCLKAATRTRNQNTHYHQRCSNTGSRFSRNAPRPSLAVMCAKYRVIQSVFLHQIGIKMCGLGCSLHHHGGSRQQARIYNSAHDLNEQRCSPVNTALPLPQRGWTWQQFEWTASEPLPECALSASRC